VIAFCGTYTKYNKKINKFSLFGNQYQKEIEHGNEVIRFDPLAAGKGFTMFRTTVRK